AVQNEFGASNTIGTLAMAKLDNQPNSATSQFFINLANNTSLDSNNGGFTVFGKLVGAADQQVVNRLAALPIKNEGSPFNEIPLSGYSGSNFPTDTTASNYALINSVTVVKRDEFLTYTVVSNSNRDLVTASIDNNRLTLDY